MDDRAAIAAAAGQPSLARPRSVSSRGGACAAQSEGATTVRLQSPDRRRVDAEGSRYIGLRFTSSEPLERLLQLMAVQLGRTPESHAAFAAPRLRRQIHDNSQPVTAAVAARRLWND